MIKITLGGAPTEIYRVQNTQAYAEDRRQALGLTNCLLRLSKGGLRHRKEVTPYG